MSLNRGQCGFSMIETLIALLLFAISVLGLSGLQALALSNNKSAELKTTALLAATDLSDRMRANLVAVQAGNYNQPAGADNSCSAVHYLHKHAAPVTCTPAQLAQDDVWDWQQRLAGVLPGGQGAVCLDSTPDDGTSAAAAACDGAGTGLVIKVFWNDKQAPSGASAGAAVVPARLSVPMQP